MRKKGSCRSFRGGPRTEEDETKLQTYKDKPIEMGDTSYGRYVKNMKKDYTAVNAEMSAEEEREKLKAALRKIDEQDTQDNEDGHD